MFDLFQPTVVKEREQKYEKYIHGGKRKKRNIKLGAAQLGEGEAKVGQPDEEKEPARTAE